MNYTIRKSFLTVTVSSHGGELQSIKTPNDREYLWQGEEATWPDRAPNLFPYIARLTEGKYTYRGLQYHLDIHGFLKDTELICSAHDENSLVLSMESSEFTKKQYPFLFFLSISYKLDQDVLHISYLIENKDTKTMFFGLGGHPGFCVPFEEGRKFEDYELHFEPDSAPKQLLFTEDCFVTERERDFVLHEDHTLPLTHEMFDNDAIILRNAGKKITLCSPNSSHFVTVDFADFPYLGLWHFPKTPVEYLCIEPWCSLPSRKDVIEDLEEQKNLISLPAKESCKKEFCIRIQ